MTGEKHNERTLSAAEVCIYKKKDGHLPVLYYCRVNYLEAEYEFGSGEYAVIIDRETGFFHAVDQKA